MKPTRENLERALDKVCGRLEQLQHVASDLAKTGMTIALTDRWRMVAEEIGRAKKEAMLALRNTSRSTAF